MRMSRKWARRGRVMVYTGIAGWIGMGLLHLIDLHGRGPQPASDWIWVLGALFFVVMLAGWGVLWRYCCCPHCGAWNIRMPSPWKRGEALHCTRCGTRLEYDDT